MTNVEKRLNKKDLNAYKNYDTNMYAMIAGVKSIVSSRSEHNFPPRPDISPE